MKKFNKLLLSLVAILSVGTLFGCNRTTSSDTGSPDSTSVTPTSETPSSPSGLSLPEDLVVGIAFCLYDTTTVKGMVTRDSLAGINHEILSMGDKQYVGYKVSDATSQYNLPDFTEVNFVSMDDEATHLSVSSFANSYIVVGEYENGQFKTDSDAPMFVIDKTKNGEDNIINRVSKVILDSVTTDELAPTLITENKFDTTSLSMENVSVKVGGDDLFSFKKGDLKSLDQYLLTLTLENKKYVAFKFNDIVSAKEKTLPAITKVKAGTFEKEMTSLDNAYILVAKADDGYDTLNNIPRFVFDYTNVTAVNNDIAKAVTEIVINPVSEPEVSETLLGKLTLSYSGKTLTIGFEDKSGSSQDSTIVIDSTDLVSATTVTIGGTATEIFTDNRVKILNKDGENYGYSVTDILACIGKINNKGNFKALNETYSFVKLFSNSAEVGRINADKFATVNIINNTKKSDIRAYEGDTNLATFIIMEIYA